MSRKKTRNSGQRAASRPRQVETDEKRRKSRKKKIIAWTGGLAAPIVAGTLAHLFSTGFQQKLDSASSAGPSRPRRPRLRRRILPSGQRALYPQHLHQPIIRQACRSPWYPKTPLTPETRAGYGRSLAHLP